MRKKEPHIVKFFMRISHTNVTETHQMITIAKLRELLDPEVFRLDRGNGYYRLSVDPDKLVQHGKKQFEFDWKTLAYVLAGSALTAIAVAIAGRV